MKFAVILMNGNIIFLKKETLKKCLPNSKHVTLRTGLRSGVVVIAGWADGTAEEMV